MTFKEIQDDALERCNYDNALTSSTPRTRIKRFINEWHRRTLSNPGLRSLRDSTFTFATVASTAQYGLTQTLARVRGIHDRTNDTSLRQVDLAWIRQRDPGLDASGNPLYWAMVGIQGVAVQPSDASSLFIDSTSASDTNTAYVEGIRTGGYAQAVSVTMTGTTAVDVSTTTSDWIEITKVYLDTAAVGTVTLHEDASGGTTLATIPIGKKFARQPWVQVWPTPSAAITLYVDYTRRVDDLINDDDEPFLPADFHYLLSLGARANEFERMDDGRSGVARQDLEAGILALLSYVSNLPDYLIVPGQAPRVPSRLGSMFPAGS